MKLVVWKPVMSCSPEDVLKEAVSLGLITEIILNFCSTEITDTKYRYPIKILTASSAVWRMSLQKNVRRYRKKPNG